MIILKGMLESNNVDQAIVATKIKQKSYYGEKSKVKM